MKLLKDKRAEILREVLQGQPEEVEVDLSQIRTSPDITPRERREASAAVVLQVISDLAPVAIDVIREEFVKRTKGNFRLGIGLPLHEFLLMELNNERVVLKGVDFSLTEKGEAALQSQLDLIQKVFPQTGLPKEPHEQV